MNSDLQQKLEALALKKSIAFCYCCYTPRHLQSVEATRDSLAYYEGLVLETLALEVVLITLLHGLPAPL